MPFLFGQMRVEIPWKDETIFGYHRIIYVVTIRIYLVIIDIRIVDCHMYPGEPCPPSLVLLYIPAETLMQYNPLYTNHIILQVGS